ncbi:DUF1642 domain-containing protein [Carnobacterium sp. ISL-102]|uniref:DUF1642 domain-containing protein n=1 Tax=Carnobacterium sp. ISL-102 TaxID=2819142 RepID=UPI001BE719A3|nr:DUF1642 domain-containing protein [Carnobacterium sp. ISL-102]MBT2732100.1 DUF1642 domain-containing protein [Carnobacterium sp. ISL-102]
MKKDKEWLKTVVKKERNMARELYAEDVYNIVLDIIDQLDEPKIPVIPQFDGHTIEPEPEKLYRVKFAKAIRSSREMYLEKNDEEGGNYSIDWSEKEFIENEYPDVYLFTEKEIKAIDERYWAFAEEVSNENHSIEQPKTRQVLVKFFDNEEYKTELTEDAARELIEFLEAN